MIKTYTIADQAVWTSYIKRAAAYDFYHTWYYHHLDSNESARLYVYEEEEDFIAFPLVLREIPGTAFYDLTCVYGYTGPISNRLFEDTEASIFTRFHIAFATFLKASKIVSVFARLHPFYHQDKLFSGVSGLFPNGKTVAIDIRVPIEEQRSGYHKSYRQQIRILKEKGYRVVESKDAAHVQKYAEIYAENMKRVGASDYYMFTTDYFLNLLSSDEYESKLMLVFLEDEIVSGGVVICSNKIMQMHLMSTTAAHLSLSPPKLVVEETSILGRQLGYEYINLGGGLNFKEDSLFKWKSGFTKLFLPYNSWRYVVNQEVYDQMLNEKGIDPDLEVDFFPLYRYQKKAD
jgi:hypothetical protein